MVRVFYALAAAMVHVAGTHGQQIVLGAGALDPGEVRYQYAYPGTAIEVHLRLLTASKLESIWHHSHRHDFLPLFQCLSVERQRRAGPGANTRYDSP